MTSPPTSHHGAPLHCNPEVGTCTLPPHSPAVPPVGHPADPANADPLALAPRDASTPPVATLHLFTDPICSACWGLEPQLRRLELHAGGALRVIHHLGGLLRSWRHLAHAPISAPHQVAHHWEEMARHLGMPMTGAVWHDDPLDSSDRPATAVHAAAAQHPAAALPFLRRLREALFLEGRNITRDAVLADAACAEGLDPDRLLADTDDPRGAPRARFEEDLALGEALGVRAFPTLRLVPHGTPPRPPGHRGVTAPPDALATEPSAVRVITGIRPWRALLAELAQLTGAALPPAPALRPPGITVGDLDGLHRLWARHASWTATEVAVALDLALPDALHLLGLAEHRGHLVRHELAAGPLWRRR